MDCGPVFLASWVFLCCWSVTDTGELSLKYSEKDEITARASEAEPAVTVRHIALLSLFMLLL